MRQLSGNPADAREGPRGRPVAPGHRRSLVDRGRRPVHAIAHGESDGRAPAYGREPAPVSLEAGRREPAQQAAGAADVAHRPRGALDAEPHGAAAPAESGGRRGAARSHPGRVAGCARGEHLHAAADRLVEGHQSRADARGSRGDERREPGAAVCGPRVRPGCAHQPSGHDCRARQLHRDARLQAPSGHLRRVPRHPPSVALAPSRERGPGVGHLLRQEHGGLRGSGRAPPRVDRRIAMPFYERGRVRIHYEEVGSGFPLLLIPGGGLNSALSSWQTASPFNPMERYKDDFRCICADLRNADGGQSSGPLEIDRPWDAYADDQLGLMDHLGIREFMVMGFCIGGPFIWNLLRRAPTRIVAAVLAQPSGFRPEMPDLFYQNNITGWGPALVKRRPEITMAMVDRFLTKMYRTNPDFVFTVSRDFVRSIQTPLLVAPDDVPAHPYKVAMEVASLAPNAEVTIYPWKDSQEHIDEVVEHARRFLKAHEPVTAGRQGRV